jgi:hypothetical protein
MFRRRRRNGHARRCQARALPGSRRAGVHPGFRETLSSAREVPRFARKDNAVNVRRLGRRISRSIAGAGMWERLAACAKLLRGLSAAILLKLCLLSSARPLPLSAAPAHKGAC